MPLEIYALPVEARPLGGYGLWEATVALPGGRSVTARAWGQQEAIYNARRKALRLLMRETAYA